jgi:type VI secretion system protein ImpH
VIGERTWHTQSRFPRRLGPLSFSELRALPSKGPQRARLHDLVKLYVGVEHSWEVKLVLKKDEVPLAWLGNSVWVGWSSGSGRG